MRKYKQIDYVKWVLFVILCFCLVGVLIYENYKIDQVATTRSGIETQQTKPSYNYLKSVTVLINGTGELPISDSIKQKKLVQYKYYLKDNTEGIQWMGTGVIIAIKNNETYILTNAHVIGQEFNNVCLFIEDNARQYEAKIVKVHNKLDIALIKVNQKLKHKQAIKGIAVANPQDKVYVVGHHLGTPYIYGEGVFAGYAGIYDKIQIPCMWGSSGSGVFDKNSDLIALVCGIEYRIIVIFPVFNTSHALAIDGLSIKLFLNEVKEIL